MKPRLITGVLVTSFAAQACYAFDPWGNATRSPHYETAREVRVGSTLQVQADVSGENVTVASSAVPQCRDAKFGTMMESQSRNGTPSFWAHITWFLALAGSDAGFIALASDGGQHDIKDGGKFVAGLVGLGITNAMLLLYLPSLLMDSPTITPWFMPHHDFQTRSLAVGPASSWAGDTHSCGSAVGYPSLPVGVLVTFARSNRSILWRGKTDANDSISFEITRTIQAVAHHCGAPHVSVGQLVNKNDKKDTNEGTPDSPRALLREASDVVINVAGDVDVPLESIHDAWSRQVATECHRASLDACARNMDQAAGEAARDACADQCATKLAGDICVLKRRNCLAVMSGPSDKVYCDQGLAQCVTENGASLSALDTCKRECFDQMVSARCK